MKTSLYIFKIGGKVLSEPELYQAALTTFTQLEGWKILVHGGGKKATEISKKLDIIPKMVNGLRITDAATLEVATMVYGGLMNKQLVADLQMMGSNALGMSGADGNSILAHKRKAGEIDFGFAGDIDKVNTIGISKLLEAGFQPVFCALTHNGKGQLLNTNADRIAAYLAMAFADQYQVKLWFCFEKNGVLANSEEDHSVIPSICFEDYLQYKENGTISEGMLPKMEYAFTALQEKVSRVAIGSPNSLAGNSATVISL